MNGIRFLAQSATTARMTRPKFEEKLRYGSVPSSSGKTQGQPSRTGAPSSTGPASPPGVRQAIVGPGLARGVRFESEAMIQQLVDAGIEGSLPLLQFLWDHQTKPEFTCRFSWKPGSLAFWDNRCAMHNPVNDYHGFRRVMHRITLAGDKPR